MQEHDTFDTVHARVLHGFPELVETLGGDPLSLLEKVGIANPGDPPDQGDASYRQLASLLELAAAELQCPDFGLRLAERQNGEGMFGPLGQVMKSSKTFGEALDYVCTHNYAHSLAARVWLQPLGAGQGVFVGHDILLDRMPDRAQAMEQVLLLGHLAALQITGGRARARRVHFRHQPLSTRRAYHRYFGCEVQFGENADGVVFSPRDLACPIVDPDAQAFEDMVAFIERRFTRRRPPLAAETRGVIMRLLATGDSSNERVAAALGLHLRTLHRRLTAEGTSFQQVKDEVRRDVMLYYLQRTELDFSRVAEKLGYAEQSVLSRYCSRWFDASPTDLRLQARRQSRTG